MLHLRRESLRIYVLHLRDAITYCIQKRHGVVMLAQLSDYILYARGLRLDQLFKLVTHTRHKL